MAERILALDSASGACSACVCDGDKVLAFTLINRGLTHSQTLLPAVDQVLSEAATEISDLSLIALTVGPGSFTGLKIGAATAKGLAFAGETECAALSSLLCLAYSCREEEGIICASLDARRNMLYNALFRCENRKITRLCPDRQISLSDLKEELDQFSCPVFFAGDGSLPVYEAAGKKENMFFDPERLDIRADLVALAAFCGEGERVSAERLSPEYLRLPQAERERRERLSKK